MEASRNSLGGAEDVAPFDARLPGDGGLKPADPQEKPIGRLSAARLAGAAAAAAGLALILLAAAAGHAWAEAHFLPAWGRSWNGQLRILLVLRILAASAGLSLLLFVRPRLARGIEEGRGRAILFGTVSGLIVVALAVAATEALLRTHGWHSVQERPDFVEPMRVHDPLLGWRLRPDHSGSVRLGGRTVHYATDANGYRVRAAGHRTDFQRPSVVFAGESIVFGYGLEWPDTIAARFERRTGIGAVNIAVNAYATDQILLRLRRELPRFAHPLAVVIPFVPVVFDRNLDRDRPHLDAALRWHPGNPPPLRLVELGRHALRYRSAQAIREGVAMSQAALREAMALARAQGAEPLILVPQERPEKPRHTDVRRMVLDAGHIPYLLVWLPRAWRNPVDSHPDARADQAMAAAIAKALEDRPGFRERMKSRASAARLP